MRDKAIREVGRILFPLAEKVVLTKASGNPRAASTAELREAIGECGTRLMEAADVAVRCGWRWLKRSRLARAPCW